MSRYSTAVDCDWFKRRLTRAMFCVMVVFLVLMGRLFYLQIIEGDEYRRLSQNNCIRLKGIRPSRGLIYDRNGVLLVDNRPSFDLSIVPGDARPVRETLQKLMYVAGISEEELNQKVAAGRRRGSYQPILIRQDIGRNMMAAVEAHQFDLPGVTVDFKPRRQYLFDGAAAHLIGYLGEISADELSGNQFPGVQGGDYIGKYGVERRYEDVLRGENGGRQVEVDARGRVVRVLEEEKAKPGRNIWLTIDLHCQQYAETLMKGKVGALAALDPDTGKIIALASSPTFGQNAFIRGIGREDWNALVSNPDRPMENKAVTAEYPPASTYKIVTALAGLEEGVIDSRTRMFCPGHFRFGNRTFRCWRRGGHGNVNVVDALAVSCDVYFYQVGLKLGVDTLAKYARICGLGRPTGVSLVHEADGLIPTSAWKLRRFGVPWQKGETLSIAIGQGYNLATPLQMAVLTGAIASGGVYRRPVLIEKIVSSEGEVTRPPADQDAVYRLPFSPANLDIVREGMRQVVNGSRGTARIARLDGIEISGKTGTAQVVSRKSGDNSRNRKLADHHKPHAWFVAFAAYGGRKVAVSVFVEHGEHGSGTAAPIARDFIREYFMREHAPAATCAMLRGR